MPKVLKYLLWLLGGLALLLGLAAAYISLAPLPTYEPNIPNEVTIPYGDSVALAQGARIVSMTCVNCHQNEDGTLTGQRIPEKEVGEFYIPNITNDPESGIGRYTDEELVHLLRTGIRPDGSLLVSIMPQFFKMADEDLYSVIAYLRSDAPRVQPVTKTWPKNKPSILVKGLMHLVFKPAPMPDGPVAPPPTDDLIARGEYLANAIYDCYQCHSASFTTNNGQKPALSEGYYGGGNPILGKTGEVALSANLTMHPEYGLGEWTLEDFGKAIRQMLRPDGQMLTSSMPPFTALKDDEVAAIWAFLQSLPVQDNNVRAQ